MHARGTIPGAKEAGLKRRSLERRLPRGPIDSFGSRYSNRMRKEPPPTVSQINKSSPPLQFDDFRSRGIYRDDFARFAFQRNMFHARRRNSRDRRVILETVTTFGDLVSGLGLSQSQVLLDFRRVRFAREGIRKNPPEASRPRERKINGKSFTPSCPFSSVPRARARRSVRPTPGIT